MPIKRESDPEKRMFDEQGKEFQLNAVGKKVFLPKDYDTQVEKLPDYGPSYASESDDTSNIDDSELELKRKRDRREKKTGNEKNREIPIELTGPYQDRWVLSDSVLHPQGSNPPPTIDPETIAKQKAAVHAENHAAARAAKRLSTKPSAVKRRLKTSEDPGYEARRKAAPAAGACCTQCWEKLIRDPRRKCEIAKVNCRACRETDRQLCLWAEEEFWEDIRVCLVLRDKFVNWLDKHPQFDFTTITDCLDPREVKQVLPFPINIPKEYRNLFNAVLALVESGA